MKTRRARLLLINPPFIRKIKGQTPLNLAYLAAAFQDTDVEVKIIDLNVLSNEKLIEALKEFRPTHAGIARYSPNSKTSIDILDQVRDFDKNIILIIGGPHEHWQGFKTKEKYPWIHYVIQDKNAEEKLVNVVTGKSLAVDWKTIFPAYHLLDMNQKSYRFDEDIFPRKKMIQYMSARGCTMKCSFCPSGAYIPKSISTVISHLKKIKEMGYNAIFFNDVNFAADTIRTKELLLAMIAEKINLEWGCQTTANEALSDELIQLMRKAGSTYITYSIENISPAGLKSLNKKINPEIVTHKCIVAKQSGMKVGLYVMFGIHENKDEDFFWAKKTLDKLEEIKPDFVSYSLLSQYPNVNPNIDYDNFVPTNPVWDFFDEGYGYHPYCDEDYAVKLKDEIERRHIANLSAVKIF